MILSGTALADEMLALVKNTIDASSVHPRLAVVQVGDDAASTLYIERKKKIAAEIGIETEFFSIDHTTTKELVERIYELNTRPDIDAILVQIPLPKNIDTDAVIAAIDPAKDVDGFHPRNIGAYTTGQAVHTPVLVQSIEWLLKKTSVPLSGKHAVVLGKSDVFLQPLTFMLSLHGLNVTWIKPQDLPSPEIMRADVLIVAVGAPHTITEDMIKPDSIIIDIGINRLENGKVVGDVDFDRTHSKAAWITPTPGGVGPVTIAALMWNTLRLALDRS